MKVWWIWRWIFAWICNHHLRIVKKLMESKSPMKIEFLILFPAAARYGEAAQQTGVDLSALWNECVIKPYWPRIAELAPFDMSYMKPSPIRNLVVLPEQIQRFMHIDLDTLRNQFQHIAGRLPKDDDDPLLVALCPLDHANIPVRERQNGVVGACVFGNILLNINPLADDFDRWLPYVFAHEYHHSLWGHHWYVQKGGQDLQGNLLEHLITEGQADAFACSLFPDLKPSWIFDIEQAYPSLWSEMENVFDSTDPEVIQRYTFGDESAGLPWCIGYSVGNRLVNRYMSHHPDIPFFDLLCVHPQDFLLTD